jgi:hypothetical protein
MERANYGEGRDALDQKGAWVQKWSANRDLKRGATQSGGVRHDCDQGAVLVAARHATDQRWSSLPGQAGVNEPEFTARRRRPGGFTARRRSARRAWARTQEVEVTLEVEAEIPPGVPDNVVRLVAGNSRTPKFRAHGSEKG